MTLVATISIRGASASSVSGNTLWPTTVWQRAQLACSVVDEYQGRGIGALLLEHVLGIARAQGVVEFEADMLSDNYKMLRLFTRSGLTMHRSTQAGVVHLTFSDAEADQFLAAA